MHSGNQTQTNSCLSERQQLYTKTTWQPCSSSNCKGPQILKGTTPKVWVSFPNLDMEASLNQAFISGTCSLWTLNTHQVMIKAAGWWINDVPMKGKHCSSKRHYAKTCQHNTIEAQDNCPLLIGWEYLYLYIYILPHSENDTSFIWHNWVYK